MKLILLILLHQTLRSPVIPSNQRLLQFLFQHGATYSFKVSDFFLLIILPLDHIPLDPILLDLVQTLLF